MVELDVQSLSTGFSIVSGFVAVGLIVLSLRAFRANRDPAMAFLTGAFTVFGLKSFYVAYGVASGTVGHETLELIDAVGDLATVLLLVLPIFLVKA